MDTKKTITGIFLLNLLVVITALTIFFLTGKSHFKESGFVTIFSCLQLLATSMIIFLIHKHSLWRSSAPIWKIIALGFLFLAADEVFKIHEDLDKLIHAVFSITPTGLTDRIDDFLVGLYGLIGMAVMYAYRNELKPYTGFAPYFILGFVLLFSMVILDAVTNRSDFLSAILKKDLVRPVHTTLSLAEDSFKVFAESLFLSGFFAIFQKAKKDSTSKP